MGIRAHNKAVNTLKKKNSVTVKKAITDFQQKGFCSLLTYFLIFFVLSSRVGNKSKLKKIYVFFFLCYVESFSEQNYR